MCSAALGGEFSTNPTPELHEYVRRVCERDRDGEVPRVRVSSLQEANSANPSVRSTTSPVGVAAVEDTDLEGPALRLGCDRVSSSSSEVITYIV